MTKTLIARLKSALRTPILIAALVAVFGTTAVHAVCPKEMSATYEGYMLYCVLMAEVNGLCLMDCQEIDLRPIMGL